MPSHYLSQCCYFLLIGPLATNFSAIWLQIKLLSLQKINLKNCINKMLAILSLYPCASWFKRDRAEMSNSNQIKHKTNNAIQIYWCFSIKMSACIVLIYTISNSLCYFALQIGSGGSQAHQQVKYSTFTSDKEIPLALIRAAIFVSHLKNQLKKFASTKCWPFCHRIIVLLDS